METTFFWFLRLEERFSGRVGRAWLKQKNNKKNGRRGKLEINLPIRAAIKPNGQTIQSKHSFCSNKYFNCNAIHITAMI